jgi:hypothetical protein
METKQLLLFLLERMEALEKFVTLDEYGNETKRIISAEIALTCKRRIQQHLQETQQ